MRLLFFFVVFCIFAINLYGQEKFVLEGKVDGFADSTWLMLRNAELEAIVDSTLIIDNVFKFEGEVNGPEQFIISTRFTGNPDSHKYKFLWIEPGKIFLEGEYGNFRYAAVKGSKVQQQADELVSLTGHFEKKLDSLNNEYRKGSFSDSVKLAEARKLRDEIQNKEKEVKIQFIKDHPQYQYSALVLSFLMKTLEKEQTRDLYGLLDPEIQASQYGVVVKNYVDLNRKFKVGDRYADITLRNPEGKEISLSSFEGKYVLLDFWASGCGPCRMEHPRLLELYNNYKEEGLEIFAVSLDKNKKNWVNAIEKDQISWPNVSDLQGHNGEIALTYGVYYIPTNYLIDPEGVIIAKDIRGKALEEKVNSLFE